MNQTTRIQLVILTLVCTSYGSALAADSPPANPSLHGNARGIDRGEAERTELELRALDVDVVAVGALAEVSIDATFVHGGEGFSEGVFEMQLPTGAVVTGYALDVDGEMIDGVLVPRGKARVSFEERVRDGVDPGLAEVSRSNAFTTRVFPIDDGGRRIRLSFVAPIDRESGLILPLHSAGRVGAARIKISADGTALSSLELPAGFDARWSETGASPVLDVQRADVALVGRLALKTQDAEGLFVSADPARPDFFQLRAQRPAAVSSRANDGQRLRVYWDRSLSRLGGDRTGEIAVLARIVAATNPAAVDFVAFNSSGATITTVDTVGVARLIPSVVYRGATSFEALEHVRLPRADRCLLFSDGVVTIGRHASLPKGCRTDAIVAAVDADVGYLRRITRETGGSVWTLPHTTVEDVVGHVLDSSPRVIGVWDDTGAPLGFAELADDLIVGEAPRRGGVIVGHVDSYGRQQERRYTVVARSGSFSGAGALWAAAHIAELGSVDGSARVAQELARRHSVATPSMSFLVLETPDDYVQEGLAPPRNYPAELLTEYLEVKREADEEREALAREHLDEVIEQWRELEQWWEAGATAVRVQDARPRDRSRAPRPESIQSEPIAAANRDTIMVTAQRAGVASGALEEIVLTGTRSVRDPGSAVAIQIEIEPWSGDRPYLRTLDNAPAAELEGAFATQEREHGGVPAFYIDVANWLDAKGRRADAIEMLLSALELPARDEQTMLSVASRLLQWGEAMSAIALYEQLLEEYSERPQTLRWLALALAQTGQHSDLARAITLLTDVARKPWSEEDDGIAMISLLEANQLLARLPVAERGALTLDPRLIRPLDLDLRILIDWNTTASDMDLWVEEPTGESASYGNPATALRGRLSNDMTDGFGPEQYLLRKAPAGTYTVSIDSYAADSINPNGATTVNARLIRNFGRTTQSEQAIQIELAPDFEGTKTVGKFVVAE